VIRAEADRRQGKIRHRLLSREPPLAGRGLWGNENFDAIERAERLLENLGSPMQSKSGCENYVGILKSCGMLSKKG
jgi:hypothetical protein